MPCSVWCFLSWPPGLWGPCSIFLLSPFCFVAADDLVERFAIVWNRMLCCSAVFLEEVRKIMKSQTVLSHVILIVIPICNLNYFPFLYIKIHLHYVTEIGLQLHFEEFQSLIFLCPMVLLLEYSPSSFVLYLKNCLFFSTVSNNCMHPAS